MDSHDKNIPAVGVGVMIFKDEHVLLGERSRSHGEGEYAFPGGYLEYMESFEECARREVWEECGIEIENIAFQFVANVTRYAPKHFVHIGVTATWRGGEVEDKDPHTKTWNWYPLNTLPEPLFEMTHLGIESHKTGAVYYDKKS